MFNRLKYIETRIVFAEIPDEITLAINITNCPIHCPDCHSKYLWKNSGKYLTKRFLNNIINKQKGITCVCFMGGDKNPRYINRLGKFIHNKFNHTIKVGWYSGKSTLSNKISLCYFDYIKLGPYVKELGPLNFKGSNQKLYEHIKFNTGLSNEYEWKDITNKLWDDKSK